MSKERSIKDRLRNLSRETNFLFNDLWLRLVIERFLFRLSKHSQRKNFIFKGGFLLGNYITLNRGTRDIDFTIINEDVNIERISEIILDVLSLDLDDGFKFKIMEIEELSHPQIKYGGFRISILAKVGKMKQIFSIDIGVGDLAKHSIKLIKILPEKKSRIFFVAEIF